MSTLLAIAITTGILSGIWGWVALSLGLLSWAGFLGCTAYFASPKDGLKGLVLSLCTTLSGVFWGMVILHLSTLASLEIIGYLVTAIVAFLMCIQAKQTWLNFIPGTFIGSCATFASNGDWALVIPSLVLGVFFGYIMKATGLWLQKKINKSQPIPLSQESK